jgi:antitoxin PrlF
MQQHITQSSIQGDVREVTSTVSSKGQVTVPAEVRKHLGIKEGDKLSFVIEEQGKVRVETPRYRDVASLRGAAGSLTKPLSWKEMIAIAREDHVSEVADVTNAK